MQEETDYQLPLMIGGGVFTIATAIFCLFKKKPNNNNNEKITEVQVPSLNQKSKPSQPNNNDQKKKPTKKKKKPNTNKIIQGNDTTLKSIKQIQQIYGDLYYGSINLKSNKDMHGPIAIAFKGSKILISNTKNQLILYDLKKWKKDEPTHTNNHNSLSKHFTSLDYNNATAVCIGNKYLYCALNFDKTIIYYEYVQNPPTSHQHFKEVKRFNRNILKSNACMIYTNPQEKCILTAGSESETTLNVWSMSGQLLHLLNTYQIEHYSVKSSMGGRFIVRGWTSEVKVFDLISDKTGAFLKLQKSHQHLSHDDQPVCSSVCNLGLYALTVSKSMQLYMWNMAVHGSSGDNTNTNTNLKSSFEPKILEPYQVELNSIQNVMIHTLMNENQRYKTIIAVTDGQSRIVICDRKFKVWKILDGIECKGLYMIGSMKNVVLISEDKQGRLWVWNLTKVVEEFEEYA